MSAGNSLTARERKRVKTVLKGSATDDSFDTMLMKVEEVSSKMTKSPNDAGQSSKHSSGHNSNKNSQQTKSVDDSRSMNSRTTWSGKSSRKSSRRSSARSMESMDGHTELLESLVHAAHVSSHLGLVLALGYGYTGSLLTEYHDSRVQLVMSVPWLILHLLPTYEAILVAGRRQITSRERDFAGGVEAASEKK